MILLCFWKLKAMPEAVRWQINLLIMSTYITTWQCRKCGVVVRTSRPGAGCLQGYGSRQLQDESCPGGGSHDWYELFEQWLPDDND